MRRRIVRTCASLLLVVSITGMTVFADDIDTYKNQMNQEQAVLDDLQNQLEYVINQMNELEIKMANLADKIDAANADLAEAEKTQAEQYDYMKLRIKYMYEDQSANMAEVLLSSQDMSEVLNKAEYMQGVYDYDRQKLNEFIDNANKIKEMKTNLENDQKALEATQNSLTESQELLNKTISEQEGKVANFTAIYNKAVDEANKRAAAAEAARKAEAERAAAAAAAANNSSSNKVTSPTLTSGGGNSTIASNVVSLAYSLIGIPYRSGGSSPSSGFDCSGFTSYLFAQNGISISRSSGAQAYGGTAVRSLSEALPGDIICYSGHVALYIGNGNVIHAPVPGKTVCITDAYISGTMRITAIRRYW